MKRSRFTETQTGPGSFYKSTFIGFSFLSKSTFPLINFWAIHSSFFR